MKGLAVLERYLGGLVDIVGGNKKTKVAASAWCCRHGWIGSE